jgi:hypothetical protein
MEDREWMYSGRLGQGQITDEWIDKTDAFLEWAFGEAAKGASKIVCPGARMSAEREAERLAEQQRMREILAYMESLGTATGVAPPALLFSPPRPPPPPPDPFSTPVSMDKF